MYVIAVCLFQVLMVELRRTKRVYAMKVIKKALVTDDEDIDWVQVSFSSMYVLYYWHI